MQQTRLHRRAVIGIQQISPTVITLATFPFYSQIMVWQSCIFSQTASQLKT
jgi:hypothetical protein